MKEKIRCILGIGSLCLFLFGCSKNSIVVEADDFAVDTIFTEQEVGEELDYMQGSLEYDSAYRTDQKQQVKDGLVTGTERENSIIGQEQTVQPQQLEENIDRNNMEVEGKAIVIHICGAVNQPGVYTLQEGNRIYDVVQKADGFREDAGEEYLNLAQLLEDGMKITVPTKEEAKKWQNGNVEAIQRTQEVQADSKASVQSRGESSKVNLNTANESELCTLPGIGESRAKSIIEYRKQHGGFEKVEDIMKVSGIKEAAYKKIKDYITVS